MLNQLDRENIDKAIDRIIKNIKESLPKIDKPINVRIEELKKISANITITESKMLLSDICVSLRKETLKKEIFKKNIYVSIPNSYYIRDTIFHF